MDLVGLINIGRWIGRVGMGLEKVGEENVWIYLIKIVNIYV